MKHLFSSVILVLVFLMTPIAYGKECKVNDPDIAKHYEGGCKNGLAHGEGLARGRDEYKGGFRNGNPHGFGVYKWGKDSDWATEIYEGSWYEGDKTGFGTVSVSANSSAPGIKWVTEQGQLVGKRYVHHGYWYKDNLIHTCESQENCFVSFVEKHNLAPKGKGNAQKISTQQLRTKLTELLKDKIDESDIPEELKDKVSACFIDMVVNELPTDKDGFIILNESTAEKMNQLLARQSLMQEQLKGCVASSVFTPIDFNVLKVDMESMRGERVSVEGIGIHMMDLFIIKKDEGSTNMISVDISNIDRDQKIMILNKCANPILGCKVTVYGSVDDVSFETGIVAKLVEFR
ncbi:MAG: hypothetical protein RQ723_10470 [Desulfuromonadales bacterium]|nr:hypothetical protein [Desulfuromonadales bacterium]